MTYPVTRNQAYDFVDQSYKDCYPNLHKYPATMLPQIGIKVLQEMNVKSGEMLDPYCGSGSSFACGLEVGIKNFTGFDLNPLAVAITQTRFSWINPKSLKSAISTLREVVFKKSWQGGFLFNPSHFDYWFSSSVAERLEFLRVEIENIKDEKIKRFMLLGLSLTVRDCSYTRNNEFKLYRIKPELVNFFNPDVYSIFFNHADYLMNIYLAHYKNKTRGIKLTLTNGYFRANSQQYETVLTSPPYGDSKTTVAYGQFSLFSNQWLFGKGDARKLDNNLMGGKVNGDGEIKHSLINEPITKIAKINEKRAKEVAAFYKDLYASITEVAKSVKTKGRIIYVVGNRMVKGVSLPTDQFIAESFCDNDFTHLVTYERLISNKTMPKSNSPTNKAGVTLATMNSERIIVCAKN